ncbi:FAD-dependent thymidylate synthase [Cognatishimia sp.]|uniref:FAD-dependent thymidylate synthase n=1 Tax=Cognatishimia sp. TaxID=2211648 RepID=UPI003519BAEB|nr:FAD-dependent thymidylate synthase [Cognatishimia sp.]
MESDSAIIKLMKTDLGSVGFVELLDHMGDDLGIVNAAKVSYFNQAEEFGPKELRLLNFLLKNKHVSPMEQTSLKFRVKCPLYISHQWMRHRTWAYNQVSRRYTKQNIEMYVPEKLRAQHKVNKQCSYDDQHIDDQTFINSIENTFSICLQAYNSMIEAGVANEIARGVLPCGIMTEFICTVNLRNFINFWELREKEDAQYEIRVFAKAMMDQVETVFPRSIELYKELSGIHKTVNALISKYSLDELTGKFEGLSKELENEFQG